MASTGACSCTTSNLGKAFEGITPPYAQASSSKGPWDVFINHRGKDVKHTLATTIYNMLHRTGLRVFLDKESLEAGDVIPTEIQEAMCTASVHIAIFSPNYARSAWCLAELSFMLKTCTKIIPVFYHIDPCDLRWVAHGKGCYASAFSLHEEKGYYTSEKLQEWKMALENISIYSGCVVNSNCDEGKLIKDIANRVFRTMKKVPLEVAKHPVGLDRMVSEVERCILLESGKSDRKVQILGIVGMGGVGKTTLATELYNRKWPSFNACSFIFDIRDAASKNTLYKKQKKLLRDIDVNSQDLCFDHVEEGKTILASRLRSVCALIVLDDADHEEQLNALLPAMHSLASGSLIIVTSRESEVLIKWGISSDAIYKMSGLNQHHAKQLFCWHAFLQPHPEEGFEDLVEQFLDVCSGLPLSLKVLGGQVYTKSKDYWKAQLHKMSRILPRDISLRLKVSYDALDDHEQEMFMDVACFFIGEKVSVALAVWDGSGWSGLHGWESLVNKCLANLDQHNCITMHDHLRDLGRDLAYRHSPSRMWHQEQVVNTQKQAVDGMHIRGLKFTDTSSSFKMPRRPKSFSHGLELLIDTTYGFAKQVVTPSENLVWLRGIGFPIRKLPSWLSLRNMRILELKDAYHLEELWDNAVPPVQLRELTISKGCQLQRFPTSIGHLKDLKKITVSSSHKMKNLPKEFCSLESLEHLELVDCGGLYSLPSSFGVLRKLRYISLASCNALLTLPDSFEHLIHLQYLNLEFCLWIRFRLDMLGNMKKLEYLNLKGCRRLKELPVQITDQLPLKKLPNHSAQEVKLETLKIGSRFLKSLPDSLWNLHMLKLIDISSTQVSTISIPQDCCPRLEALALWKNHHLQHIGSVPASVKSLLVCFCRKLKCIANTSSLVNLRLLYLIKCPQLNEIPSFSDSVSLYKIVIDECMKVEKLEGLQHAISLHQLIAMTCWKSQGIQSLDRIDNLETVKLIAENRSALYPCIQTMKEWPRDMLIGGRAVCGAHSMMESLSFPNVTAIRRGRCWLSGDGWKPHIHNAGAAIICFITTYSKAFLANQPEVWNREKLKTYYENSNDIDDDSKSLKTCHRNSDGTLLKVGKKEGKWVYVALYTRGSNIMNNDINNYFHHLPHRRVLVVGEEASVVQAFTQFWNLFM